MQNKKAYELVTTGKAGVPGIPARDGFNGFLRDLPGDRACCHRRFASEQNLTPASRRQDHTTSPSAFSTVRQRCVRVHRIPPRVRDDRERPSVERDGAIRKVFCLYKERKYFCDWCWTGVLPVRPGPVTGPAEDRCVSSLKERGCTFVQCTQRKTGAKDKWDQHQQAYSDFPER